MREHVTERSPYYTRSHCSGLFVRRKRAKSPEDTKMALSNWTETEEQIRARWERLGLNPPAADASNRELLESTLANAEKFIAITDTATQAIVDDRTAEWKANHDMTDPRNQLPTEAERQEFSRLRLAAGYWREIFPSAQTVNTEAKKITKDSTVEQARRYLAIIRRYGLQAKIKRSVSFIVEWTAGILVGMFVYLCFAVGFETLLVWVLL